MPSATTRPSSPSATSPQPHPPLPPPSTFDILPPLHTLLTRLLLPPPPQSSQSTANSPASPTSSAQNDYLSPKNIGSAASAVKIKIQKARVAVLGLPDVERTVEEQEEEIRELETEVGRLRAVLTRLAGEGERGVKRLEGREGKEEDGMIEVVQEGG